MEMESPPPSVAPNATSPRPPIAPSKLRLMCSYGGHIVPRPHDKCLFYAGGDIRIVTLDRRTTAASLSSLTSHLSRLLFHNRPFHLKYQLPSEDLDSLISVITDEDLANMIEENDRIIQPTRIRLFLFPVKPESLGTALLDPKSESWFSDVLKSTQILQKGHSADCGMLIEIGSELVAPIDIRSNNGGGEGKHGAESLVLEMNSSFGSMSSSFPISNSPSIVAVHYEESGLNLQDRKARVPSSNSLESETSAGSVKDQPKSENFEEPLIQVGPDDESLENPVSSPSFDIMTQKTVQVGGYPLSQPVDAKKQQYETQLIQGGPHYGPQYANPVPMTPYYPLYQMPMQDLQHIPYPANQPCPMYLILIKPTQYHNLSMPYSSFDATTTISSSLLPMHPHTALITQPMTDREVFGAQIAESSMPVYCKIPTAAQLVNTPSNQGQQVNTPSSQGHLATDPPEPKLASEPVTTAPVVPSIQGSELDEDIAYNQIYKTQPSPPILSSQYPTVTKDAVILQPLVQLPANHTPQQATLHPK